jgi:hypothetical protein
MLRLSRYPHPRLGNNEWFFSTSCLVIRFARRLSSAFDCLVTFLLVSHRYLVRLPHSCRGWSASLSLLARSTSQASRSSQDYGCIQRPRSRLDQAGQPVELFRFGFPPRNQRTKQNGFKLFSSQILFLKGPNSVNSCHYFDDVSLSNFRSCCLPWKWRQCLRPPLRNQTLIPRHPLEPFWSKAPQTKLIDQSQVQSVERPRGSIDQPIYSTSKEWDEVLSIISFNKFTLKSSQP